MNIKKNYIYSVMYQMLLIILPIITVPYITRVLGTNGVGINTYTNSIIQYFILIGSLGIDTYGNRTIAFVRDNKKNLSKQFWGIFILKLFTTIFAYLFFLLYIFLYDSNYKKFLCIQSINIISVAVDISWLFMGMEDFKKTVTRNMIFKIIGIILIFTFVKSKNDLWIYILISGLSNLIGQIILWTYLPKIVIRCKLCFRDIVKHLFPSLKLFIPQAAIQIYSIFDKTLIGYMGSVNEAGIYDMGEKIVYMSITLISSMGTVMLPRITNTLSKGNIKKIREYIIKSFNFVSYISIPMCFGIISISKGFSFWFYGKSFMKSGYIMSIESIIIIMTSWSMITGVQILIPFGRLNEYTLSILLGALGDIISNLLLVGHLYSIGAAISTVIAETIVTVVQFILLRKELPLKEMFKEIWKYFISALIMFFVINNVGIFIKYNLLSTLFQIIIGICIYIISQTILKSKFQRSILLDIKATIKNKL